MDILVFTLLVGAGSFAAGVLGALTGLGGGSLLVTMLVLFFGVDMHYAMGASLVSVIATSSGAAAAYVREGYSNLRVGMVLETATTTGALFGAFLALYVTTGMLSLIFGLVLLYSAWVSGRPQDDSGKVDDPPDPLATKLRMDSEYPTPAGRVAYHVHNVPAGYGLMFVAGGLSGLLGIGSGAVKVLAMDQAMRLPFKVSTTTSNFMIGVTAAASAGIYLNRGYIDPGLVMPVTLGVLAGAILGAVILEKSKPNLLRKIFTLVVLALAVQMIYNGIAGKL